MASVGGYTDWKPANSEIQEIAKQMKEDVEKSSKKTFTKFEAISYQSQIVAGTNYKIKVDTEHGVIEILVFQALPCNVFDGYLTSLVLWNQSLNVQQCRETYRLYENHLRKSKKEEAQFVIAPFYDEVFDWIRSAEV